MKNTRLQKICEKIDNKGLIDIGTDHAYLLIDAIKKGKIENGLAVEISEGPLLNAEKNIKKNNMSSQIKTLKSDGLKDIEEKEIEKYDSISICGMGGNLISDILLESKNKLFGKKLYLQPNNKANNLRNTLMELNFEIIYEELIKDNEIIYDFIIAIPVDKKINYTENELFFGPFILNNKTNLFNEKYNNELDYLLRLKEKLNDKNIEKKVINKKIKILKEQL